MKASLVLVGAIAAASIGGCSAGGCGDAGRSDAGRSAPSVQPSAQHSAQPWAGPTPSAASLAVPSIDVPRRPAGAEVVIDGAIDEPAWSRAASTGAFVDAGSGAPATDLPVGGSARLLWDDEHLFVAFEVRDRTLRGGFPEGSIDPHLWERDAVELMIDPDGDGDNRDYYEIQVSPQNLVFDSRFDDYNLPRGGPQGPFGHQGWTAALDSAVRLGGSLDDDSDDDDGWVVELRIPWRSFDRARKVPPAPGDVWRLNLYAMQDNGGAAWSPLRGLGNFHKARRFGRARFVDEARRP